jgi:hypothetical protein
MSDNGAVEVRFSGQDAGLVRMLAAAEQKSRAQSAAMKELGRELRKSEEAVERLRQRNQAYKETLDKTSRAAQGLRADHGKMVQEVGKYGRENDALRRKLEEVNRAQAAVGKTGQGVWSKMGNQVQALAMGMLGTAGLLTVFRAVSSELENMERRAASARNVAVDLSSARQDVVRNMPGADAETVKKTLGEGTSIAAATGVEERIIQSAMAQTLSATNVNIPASIDLVKTAATYMADRPEDIAMMAGSLGDMSKITGTMDAMTNLKYLEAAGAQSRIADPLLQARNMPRALIGLTEKGLSPEEAIALFGSITEGTADFSGESSGTAASQLAGQVLEYAKEQGITKKITNAGGEGSFSEILRYLQDNDQAAQELLDNASFEEKFKAPLLNLIGDGGSGIAQGYESRLQTMPKAEELTGTLEEIIARKQIDPLYGVAQASRVQDQAQQALQAGDAKSQMEGVFSSAELGETMQGAGVSATDQLIGKGAYWYRRIIQGQEADQAFMNTLRAETAGRAADPDNERSFATGGNDGQVGERLTSVMEKMLKVSEEIARNTAKQDASGRQSDVAGGAKGAEPVRNAAM